MTTVLNSRDVAAEERFVLRNVTWETYEQLLKNYENCSVPRLTYDQGDLEIMTPPPPHEATSRLLSLLVNIICEERELDVLDFGSTTHKRADLLKGIEPDGCFYIQNVELIRDVDDLDLTVHPPVDLAIEVDLTSPSVAKLPIYAVLGVPEVWQFEEGKIKFLRLKLSGYAAIGESVVLPGISAEAVTRFLNGASTMKRPEWLRAVREWIRSLERR